MKSRHTRVPQIALSARESLGSALSCTISCELKRLLANVPIISVCVCAPSASAAVKSWTARYPGDWLRETHSTQKFTPSTNM